MNWLWNTKMLNKKDIEKLVAIAKEAGEIAVSSRKSSDFKIKKKLDGSKVSTSDILVDEFLQKSILSITPEVKIVSEESDLPNPKDLKDDYYWLIDPIDGTSNFCSGKDEFTVNLCLLKDREPIFSIIHAPLYKMGKTAYIDKNKNLVLESLDLESNDDSKPVIVASRGINDEIIKKFVEKYLYYDENGYIIKKMSSSVKFFEILEGRSDFFLMLHRTNEWDVAAGHALIDSIGGSIFEIGNTDKLQKMQYFKKDFLNNNLIISSNYGKETCLKL